MAESSSLGDPEVAEVSSVWGEPAASSLNSLEPQHWASDAHFHLDRCRAAFRLARTASVADVCDASYPSQQSG